jgi:hypothetical protein
MNEEAKDVSEGVLDVVHLGASVFARVVHGTGAIDAKVDGGAGRGQRDRVGHDVQHANVVGTKFVIRVTAHDEYL